MELLYSVFICTYLLLAFDFILHRKNMEFLTDQYYPNTAKTSIAKAIC